MPADELRRALDARGITPDVIERAVQALDVPDPAGVLPVPTREQVAEVAAYMTRLAGRFVLQDPLWALIEQGHPAGRAIFWHELQEIKAYRRLGVPNPFGLPFPTPDYWRAHAWASWEEAAYWTAWAQAEGEDITPAAFLLVHPRMDNQIERETILDELQRSWRVAIERVDTIQLQRAWAFYRRKNLPRSTQP